MLNLSIWQSNPVWKSAKDNLKQLEKVLAQCDQVTELLICPEMFLTGYDVSGHTSVALDSEEISRIKELSIQSGIAIAGSYAINENHTNYNRFLFIHQGEIIHQYDKVHLFSMAGEADGFSAGSPSDNNIILFKGWKIRPLICYDLRFPYISYREPFADVLLYVASWPDKRILHWQQLLLARAIENQAYVIGVNRVGTDANGYRYSGHPVAIDYKGKFIIDFVENTECCLSVSLDLESLQQYRKKFPFLQDSLQVIH
jgi:omega-amidase